MTLAEPIQNSLGIVTILCIQIHTHTHIYMVYVYYIYIYSKISQRKEKSVYYGLYVESKKNTKISVYTKQK